MINTNVAFHSIISSIQNFVLYETKSVSPTHIWKCTHILI